MTYQEKLKDIRWQQRREHILRRDNYKCQSDDCRHKSKILQVHHLDYLPGMQPWDYPDDMLITLCDECHAVENKRKKAEKMLLNTLKMKGFLLGDVWALSCKFDTDAEFTESLLKVLRNGS